MNPMDLITGLNGIRDDYVLEAQAFRQKKRNKLRLSRKKLWLIAAIVALTLLLVGCAALYVLRLQDLKVSQYRYIAPAVYDENGEAVPVPTHPLQAELSGPGGNRQAIREWAAYCREYEQTGMVDESEEAEIPDSFRWTYGCRSWEMVDRLNEIAEKNGLALLSAQVTCQTGEAGVLLDALGIDRVFDGTYSDINGSFYPEGSFELYLNFELDNSQWPYSNIASYHYSKKAYFEPYGTVMSDFENAVQWNYTRRDGKTVLLAMTREQAFLFADCPDAFITVSLAASKRSGAEQVVMPRAVLEQIAEQFVFSLQPQPTDMTRVRQLQADAQAANAAQWAQRQQKRYAQGYESYIQNRLSNAYSDFNRDSMYYSLYDLNGDGVEELLPGGKLTLWEVLSLRDGESFLYGDLTDIGAFLCFEICENHILALKEYDSESRYYLRADPDGLTFLEGLWKIDGIWYRLPERPAANPADTVKSPVTDAQAEAMIASYVPLKTQPERQLMKNWGQPVKTYPWTDPYARYIAEMLDRFEDSGNFTYALMDLNGDGTDELLTRDVSTDYDDLGNPNYALAVHTIADGKLVTLDSGFTGVCENGILMRQNRAGTEYEFFRMNGTELESIERIWQDPLGLYWSRFAAGDLEHEENAFSQQTAQTYIDAYKPVALSMKPFAQYPFH